MLNALAHGKCPSEGSPGEGKVVGRKVGLAPSLSSIRLAPCVAAVRVTRKVQSLTGSLNSSRSIRPSEPYARDHDQQFDAKESIPAGHGMEQSRVGFSKSGLRIAASQQVLRGKKVRLNDPLHIAGTRGPGPNLVEVTCRILALG